MNILLKEPRLIIGMLLGLMTETIIAQDEVTGKKMGISVIMERDGSTRVMYTVYDSEDTPITSTANIQDALNRYNAIAVKQLQPGL